MQNITSTVNQKKIGITLGCPNGIGTEVFLKSLALFNSAHSLIVFAPKDLLTQNAKKYGIPYQVIDKNLYINEQHIHCSDNFKYTKDWSTAALDFQREALLYAIESAKNKDIDALVTAPINKKSLQRESEHSFPGHTELLHSQLGIGPKPLMIFAGGPFLLALATIHHPLKDVSTHLSELGLRQTLDLMIDLLKKLHPDMIYPHISVLGLNPHAGEAGLLGHEEVEIILPALEHFATTAIIDGPLSADGFFGHLHQLDPFPQAVLAMYHDQGLAPYKLMTQGQGVNITWGLKIPRTSPDHGTAYDIAGKGIADESSMLNALKWAETLLEASNITHSE